MARKRKKMTPMKYPVGQEYTYRTSLRWLTHQLKLALKKRLAPAVPEMVLEVTDIHSLSTGTMRRDAWQADLNKIMHDIARDMVPPVDKTIKEMIRLGPRINEHNKTEWRKLIRSQYGVNPTSEDPDRYNALMRNWAHSNALLIKDIPAKTMFQIRDQTIEALRSGLPVRDMADSIYNIMVDRTDVSDSRANLIARDQVAKLNGQLTRERQQDLGVGSYIWRTVGDERVRDTHEMADGNTYSWSDPPGETDGNHPGEDYQCRCWAEPILPEAVEFEASLLEEAEA